MSQDASTHTKLLTPSPDASPLSAESLGSDVIAAGSFPVESYADRLMDDLFGDVERLLDSGATPSTEPVRAEPPAIESKASKRSSFVDLVSPLVRRSEVEPSSALDAQDSDALLTNPETAQTIARTPLSESVRASVRSYDRLLLGVGCLSLLTVLAVWLLNQQAQRQAAPVAVAPPSASNPALTTADNQFISYLQQALKAIDQQQPGTPSAGVNGVSALPSVTLPGNPTIQAAPTTGATPSNPTRPATGLSRLYVPVYQVPQNGQPGSPSIAPLPSVKAPTAVRQPIPLTVPGVAKTLVGILELGDRSAALIEINGVTQRYRIGESIATSGWTLVEVSQNQAVIRRNGEVRSIFTGQSF